MAYSLRTSRIGSDIPSNQWAKISWGGCTCASTGCGNGQEGGLSDSASVMENSEGFYTLFQKIYEKYAI